LIVATLFVPILAVVGYPLALYFVLRVRLPKLRRRKA
jgi:hypothetical protein